MYDIRHSTESGEWYTPPEWVEPVREALGGSIDLDPCGNERTNQIIRADGVLSSGGELFPWSDYAALTAFANPPGACPKGGDTYSICGNKTRCSCALPKKFLERAIEFAEHGGSAVHLAYNISQIRQLSRVDLRGIGPLIAVPPVRLKYLVPETMAPGKGANADSAFIWLSRCGSDDFIRAFKARGCSVWCYL